MKNKKEGVSAAFILFVVFLVLKLTTVIDWSWWWITSPLWTPFTLGILGLILLLLFKKESKQPEKRKPMRESKFAERLREAKEKQQASKNKGHDY